MEQWTVRHLEIVACRHAVRWLKAGKLAGRGARHSRSGGIAAAQHTAASLDSPDQCRDHPPQQKLRQQQQQ